MSVQQMPAKASSVRNLLGSFLGLLVASTLFGACSGPVECKPPIAEGTVYRVTLMGETQASQGCHVVEAKLISPFMLTAGKAEATNTDPSCKNTPAASAPTQTDVAIQHCLPSETDMLGVYCTMKYPSTCEGAIKFYFMPRPGGSVDWNAPVIDNVLFRVQDFATSCLPDIANCIDEYVARLERVN